MRLFFQMASELFRIDIHYHSVEILSFALHFGFPESSEFVTAKYCTPLGKRSRTFSCTCQIFKLTFLDGNKNLPYCNAISFMQFIQFSNFSVNSWIINRIQGGMSQLVMILEKAI